MSAIYGAPAVGGGETTTESGSGFEPGLSADVSGVISPLVDRTPAGSTVRFCVNNYNLGCDPAYGSKKSE